MLILAYLIVVVAMSFVSFIGYWLDKRRSVHGGRRVPESTLHLMDFLGGWPGGLIARRRFRHKTQKISFRIMFWITVALHVFVVCVVAFIF